jgi:prepilin-type N-terminal cleavage/methylation domain-containing protein
MKNKKGFTLIELLVVVLIIGILAAIALPQYQKAVDKALVSRQLPILQAMKHAQEIHYLATGSYATSFDDLDLTIPGQSVPYTCNSGGRQTQCLDIAGASYTLQSNAGYFWARIPNASSPWCMIGVRLYNAKIVAPYNTPVMCEAAAPDIERGKRVCESLGGKIISRAADLIIYGIP